MDDPTFRENALRQRATFIPFARALQFGPDQLFEDAITQTIDWLQRDLRHPKGGFFSSVDADSGGEEGAFYAWRREELQKILTEDQYLLIETLM